MSTVKHTPGPWATNRLTINNPEDNAGHLIISADTADKHDSPTYPIVCTLQAKVINNRLDFKEAEANAKLIAAAPELLEALQNLTEWAKKAHPIGYTFDEALSAIKKATE